MNIYSIHSKSHQVLFDKYFLPTSPLDVNLVSHTMPQICESGNYFHEGWADCCRKKLPT